MKTLNQRFIWCYPRVKRNLRKTKIILTCSLRDRNGVVERYHAVNQRSGGVLIMSLIDSGCSSMDYVTYSRPETYFQWLRSEFWSIESVRYNWFLSTHDALKSSKIVSEKFPEQIRTTMTQTRRPTLVRDENYPAENPRRAINGYQPAVTTRADS